MPCPCGDRGVARLVHRLIHSCKSLISQVVRKQHHSGFLRLSTGYAQIGRWHGSCILSTVNRGLTPGPAPTDTDRHRRPAPGAALARAPELRHGDALLATLLWHPWPRIVRPAHEGHRAPGPARRRPAPLPLASGSMPPPCPAPLPCPALGERPVDAGRARVHDWRGPAHRRGTRGTVASYQAPSTGQSQPRRPRTGGEGRPYRYINCGGRLSTPEENHGLDPPPLRWATSVSVPRKKRGQWDGLAGTPRSVQVPVSAPKRGTPVSGFQDGARYEGDSGRFGAVWPRK